MPNLSEKTTDEIVKEMNDLYTKMRMIQSKPSMANQLNIIVEAYKEEYRKRLLEDPKSKKNKEKK
jgi:hypothetical protein